VKTKTKVPRIVVRKDPIRYRHHRRQWVVLFYPDWVERPVTLCRKNTHPEALNVATDPVERCRLIDFYLMAGRVNG
jgi:hypothetical protein